MSDAEIVITFQSERDLWYVQRGDTTAMVSAEDMVHEYYRWRYAGAPGVWRDRARAFCRQRVDDAARVCRQRPVTRPDDQTEGSRGRHSRDEKAGEALTT